jgi:aspartate/methionine/tyrosine aminotransferase
MSGTPPQAPANQDFFEWAHRHRREVVWMSQNTNTIPLTPRLREAILRAVDDAEYNLYPYRPGVFGLQQAIKEDLGPSAEGYDVLLTNGGIEGLYMLNRALLKPGDEVISTDPGFLPIHNQVALSNARTVELDIYGEPWKLTAEAVNEAVGPATKALLLNDPHNPLGSSYDRREVKALAEIARDNDLYLVDDITYRDFNPDHVLTSEFYPEKSLLAYSFSKGAGLAGMRVGALVAPPDLVKTIKPYDTNVLGVNVLAQRAALAALEHKDEWHRQVLDICRQNQEIIQGAVKRTPGTFLPVFPSLANNFVIDVSERGVDTDALEGKLLYDHRIHVRGGRYLSKKSGGKFIRVSFTVAVEQCRRFEDAFPAAVEALAKG